MFLACLLQYYCWCLFEIGKNRNYVTVCSCIDMFSVSWYTSANINYKIKLAQSAYAFAFKSYNFFFGKLNLINLGVDIIMTCGVCMFVCNMFIIH